MEIPLNYDPITGILTWKFRLNMPNKWNARFAGKIAGHLDSEGYWRVEWREGGVRHRHPVAIVIWAIMTGSFPDHEVDHENRIASDNRWNNLRAATRSEQTQNRERRKPFLYPVGVKRCYNRYQASIAIDKKRIYLGMYATAEAAGQAYLAARELYHPRRPNG
jgi:hypothetical protein